MTDAAKLLARLDRAIEARIAKAYGKLSTGETNAVANQGRYSDGGRTVNTSYGRGYRKRIRAPKSRAGYDVNSKRFAPGTFYARFNDKGDVEPVPTIEGEASRVPELSVNDEGEYEIVRNADGTPRMVPLTFNDDMLWDVFTEDGIPMPIPYELETVPVKNADGTPKLDKDGRPVTRPVRGDDGRYVFKQGPDGKPVKLPRVMDERAKRMVRRYQRNPNASKVPYNSSGLVKDALRVRERMLNGMSYQEALMADQGDRKSEEEDRGHRRWLRNVAHIIADLDEHSRANGGKGVLDREAIGWLDQRSEEEKGVPRFLMDEYYERPAGLTPGVNPRRETRSGGRWDPEKAEEIPAFTEDTPLKTEEGYNDYRILQLMNRLNEAAKHDRDQKKVENRRQAVTGPAGDTLSDVSSGMKYTPEQQEMLDRTNKQLRQLASALKADPKNKAYRQAVKDLRAQQDRIYNEAAAALESDKEAMTEWDKVQAEKRTNEAVEAYGTAKEKAAAIPDAYQGLTFGDADAMLDKLRTNHPDTWGQLDDDDSYDLMLLLSYLPPEARETLVNEGTVRLRRPPERTVRSRFGAKDSYRSRMLRESWDSRMQAAREFNKDEENGALSDRLMASLGMNPDGSEMEAALAPDSRQEAVAWLEENGYDMPRDRDEAAVYLLDYRGKQERRRKKESEYRFDQSMMGSVTDARDAIMESIDSDYGWNSPDRKSFMDRLTSFANGFFNVSKAGKKERKQWLAEQGLSGNKARRLMNAYSFLRATDTENPSNSKGELSRIRSLNMKALGLDPSGMFGKDDTDVSGALRRMYAANREDYMDEGDDSILYQEYRKDLDKRLARTLELLRDRSNSMDPTTNKGVQSLRMHLAGLSGEFTGMSRMEYLAAHPDSEKYGRMLDGLDKAIREKRKANEEAGAVRPDASGDENIKVTPAPVTMDIPTTRPGTRPRMVEVKGPEEKAAESVPKPAPAPAPAPTGHVGSVGNTAPKPPPGQGTSVFDEAAKLAEDRKALDAGASDEPEAATKRTPKAASDGCEGLNTPDAIAKDMDDDIDLAEMSIGDMMNYIAKTSGKEGHPYGLPVQGSVFAYGSIRNTMGQGKDPSFQGVKTVDGKVDGLTVKKVDVGRVEPSDTGSA